MRAVGVYVTGGALDMVKGESLTLTREGRIHIPVVALVASLPARQLRGRHCRPCVAVCHARTGCGAAGTHTKDQSRILSPGLNALSATCRAIW